MANQADVTNIQGYATTSQTNVAELTNIQGYAAVTTPNQVALRQTPGYVMVKGFNQVGLRSVVAYAMTATPAPLPKGVTGLQALLNMIAKKSKAVRPSTDFRVDPTEVLAGDELYNSRVKCYAEAASGLLGNMYFRYNRVKLNRMALVSSSFDLGTATTIHGLIPALNTASGLILTTDDIEDGPIASTDPTVTLIAKSSSYWFIPGDTLVVGKTLTDINTVILSDTIDW